MPKCVIDGREVEFQPGENMIEVARRAGIEIPYFCYHPGLSIVAQCRMCAVEIEKMPRLQTACTTPVAEGMKVRTQSPVAKAAQKSATSARLAFSAGVGSAAIAVDASRGTAAPVMRNWERVI